MTHGRPTLTAVFVTAAIASTAPVRAPAGAQSVQFRNVARDVGILFGHDNDRSEDRHLPETMGSGGVVWDYDNDGWADVLLVGGGPLAGERQTGDGPHHRLFRNRGDGTFADVTAASGLNGDGHGMGACAADYDNDGWTDLFITGVAADNLYRNAGDGQFVDVTVEAGIDAGPWSASCAFGDVDNDGDVDLYVTRYVDWSIDNNRHCTNSNVPAYCHPNIYNPVPDTLYRNNGDGTLTDVSREAGVGIVEGNGLGVAFGDYDQDGWIDIHVANDALPNFLFHNTGGGGFEENGFFAGVAVGANGEAQAGMGTDMADTDGDGLFEILVTNLDKETHSLYQNLGGGLFADVTVESGLAQATRPFVGFGAAFFDYDNDSDLDLAIANGDVIDNVSLYRDDTTYPQRNLLLRNDGVGRFTDVGPESGPGFALEKVSRGLLVGDLDNDGDLDVIVTNNGQEADVLRNDGGRANAALMVRAVGSISNRDGIGARLTLSGGGRVLVREVRAGSSYLGQNDLRVHFGIGAARMADRLEIRWPGGVIDVIEDIESNHILTVVEGEGVRDRRPFEPEDAGTRR